MEKEKGVFSTGRLVIGILSMVLCLFILFQSCAAGLSNAIEENGATSGSAGAVVAILMLAAGIVGVVTRNSPKRNGAIVTAVLYLIGTAMAVGQGATYPDLPIWGGIAAAFSIVYIVAAIKTK